MPEEAFFFRGKDSVNSFIHQLCTPIKEHIPLCRENVDETLSRVNSSSMCMCLFMHMHRSSLIRVCAFTHIRVCLCVQISVQALFTCLYLYRHQKLNMGPQHNAIICKSVLPPVQVFLHLITVKNTKYVVS